MSGPEIKPEATLEVARAGQADAHKGERNADEVMEVDGGERVVKSLPEPEDQHRHQQEPDPSVELTQDRACFVQHQTMILGNVWQDSAMSSC